MLPGRLRVRPEASLSHWCRPRLCWRPQRPGFPLQTQARAVGNAQVCLERKPGEGEGRGVRGDAAPSRLASPSGASEKAQSVKCMPCKSEGLGSDPQNSGKNGSAWWPQPCKSQLGRGEVEMGGSLEAPGKVAWPMWQSSHQ